LALLWLNSLESGAMLSQITFKV